MTLNTGVDNDFLRYDPKAKATKAKTDKQDYIKVNSFCKARGKAATKEGLVYFLITPDREQLPKIRKGHMQLNGNTHTLVHKPYD